MAPKRQRVLTGTIWEERVGYARAVRAGNLVFVSGTLPADEAGNILHPGKPYLQALAAFEKIEAALKELGCTRADVVRTRLYVTSIKAEVEVGRAHLEFFRDVTPACTMVEVTALASPMACVEVEADAVASE